MANLIFPTSVVIPNTVPTNGNTVPISGDQAITNTTELFLYGAYSLENITNGDTINFGNSVAPPMQINKVLNRVSGNVWLEVIGYVELKPNYPTLLLKDWKKGIERLPNNPAFTGFNF